MTKHTDPNEVKNKAVNIKYSENDVLRHGSKKNMMRAMLDARDKDETNKSK